MFLRIRDVALAAVLFAATGATAQTAPVAIIAGDEEQTVDCAPPGGAEVQLQGSGSFDPDGETLSFRWTEGATELSLEADPILLLSPGQHVLRLTVNDGFDPEAFDEVTITVNADQAPEIVLEDGSTRLWPPNHKTHPFAAADLVAEVIDDCSELGPADVFFTRATSDEPDDGRGDGNTRGDVSFAESCSVAFVRAERAGTGHGRVYELFLQVEDGAGNLSDEARFRVRVTHDQGHAPDKGPIEARYACTSCASEPSACVDAASGRVTLREYSKGPSLYWRAQGFPEGAVEDYANQLCLYVDDALAGGSSAPDKVRVKNETVKVYTKGSDLEIPALPLEEGAELRIELHDGQGCVASSFSDPDVNDGDRYQAVTN
jgi:hypothetical protein